MGTNMKMKTLSGKDADGNMVIFELESQGYMRVSNGHIQFSPNNETWVNVIAVADLKGGHGDPGKSAYEYAKQGGYTGTEEEFAEQLANGGEDGAGAVELTQAEYDNLSEEEKNADVIYFVTDSDVVNDEAEYHNAGSHNAKYRGKFLGNSVTSEQYARISEGTFKGMYIGDYWTINGVNYRIACFDYYMNCGDTPTTEHHVTIVPDTSLGKAQMNSNASNSSGYATSSMFTTGLNGAKETVRNAFGEEHILTQRHILINQVQNGYPYNYAYYDVDLILMTEANLYGCKMFSPTSTGTVAYNYCYDTNQFPLFAFNRSMIATGEQYWLRDTVSSSAFAAVSAKGQSAYYEANSTTSTIRPSFNIKG